MIDRDEPEDRLVVAGSHRPIVVWSKNNRGRYVLKPHFVGSSVEEVRAVRDSGLLHESGADHVMLRVRMRRSTLERIRVAAEHVRIRTCDAEGRKGKFMSTWVLSILLDALAALETEISAVNAAGFSGKAPRDIA
ncbi:MAG: hypothetical protein EBZ50_06420 [Alphaproteobacteria bacterium]|nr:hypothetical protein [Alphaproteobacteria bacterium]